MGGVCKGFEARRRVSRCEMKALGYQNGHGGHGWGCSTGEAKREAGSSLWKTRSTKVIKEG
eukprot:3517053-Rhodomonas_salina.1